MTGKNRVWNWYYKRIKNPCNDFENDYNTVTLSITKHMTDKKQPWAIAIFQREDTQKKFQEILGKRGTSFIASMMTIIWQSDMLKDAEPNSIYLSAMTAATLDLPINPNLWLAYILPYKQKDWKVLAQFQLWYKWFIQLAQRSGQFKTISATAVYEWQLIDENPLYGCVFDWKAKQSDKVVWYAGYFSLINWFEKTLYMPVEEMEKHGKKYSQTYKRNFGLRSTDFDAMATKTVIKLLLSKYAPLSVDMQKAVIADQGIIEDENLDNVQYPDNPPVVDAEVVINDEFLENWKSQINACDTIEELEALRKQNKPTNKDVLALFTNRKDEISTTIQD